MSASGWVIVNIEDWTVVNNYSDQAEARAACEEMNESANKYLVMYL